MALAPAPLFLVSTHTDDEGILVYRLADGDGHLELLHQYREIVNPFFIGLHPNGRVLYSISTPDHVAALSLDRSSGELELINTQPTQGGPCYVEVDPSGRMAVAANYTDGSVISYPLGKDGALGKPASFVQHVGHSVHWRRQTEPHAHCIKVSGDGRFAFAADLGTDRINIYALDPAAGRLSPGEQRFARVPPESGPRHFTFSPDHRHGYVINEIGNTITAFAYDAERGLLLERDTVPTLPADFDGESGTADLAFTPDGRFLYGTNRGHDSIAMFKVDADSGVLSSNGFEPSRGEMPQNLTMTPDGKLLFVTNTKGNRVVAFHIEEDSGKLEFSCETEGPAPGCAVLG
jgi:6-phosphogluconolactonase